MLRTLRGVDRPPSTGGRSAFSDEGALSLLRRFWPFTRGIRRWMVLAGLLLAVLPVVQAAEVWLFKSLVDDVLLPRDLDPLPLLAAMAVGLNLASGALGFGDTMVSAYAGERFVLALRRSTFGHLLRLSPVQVARRPMGDLLTRLSSDVSAIEGFLVGGPSTLLELTVRVVIFTGMLVWIDPVLALVALVATPLFWAVGRRFSTTIRNAAREKRRRTGALQSLSEEVLAALPQVQAATAEDHEGRRYDDEGEGVVRAEMRASRVIGLFSPLVDLVELIGGLAVVATGAWALAAGRVTLGELLAFMTYLTLLYSPVRNLTHLVASGSKAAAGAERIAELLDERPATDDDEHAGDSDEAAPREVGAGVVSVEGLRYRYPGAEDWALDGVSFRAEPGTVTAIVGPSGSGKSTLVWLLMRMVEPTEGTICFDGQDLGSMSVRAVRRQVGVLFQDTYLFGGTIADNVAYGDSAPRSDCVTAALRDADAAEFVDRLPAGAQHDVGPKGRSLSGGQRRRIALARTLYQDRRIVVLDEFSTGLDTASTARVLDRLRRADRTVLVITHDPVVVAFADRSVVLERGRVVPCGREAPTGRDAIGAPA